MRLKLQQPGLGMSVALSLMVIGLQMAISTPLYMLDMGLSRMKGISGGFASHPLTMGLVNITAFAGVLWLALFLNKLSFARAFPWRKVTLGQVAGLVVMVLGCIVVISEADNLMRRVFPVPKWLTDMVQELLFKGDNFSRFFLLVIVAPFTEELLFRGMILRGLLNRFRPFGAVMISSLLFAFVHLNPWQFMTALLLGWVVGWAYLRTGSIWLCVLGHAVVNGVFFLVSTFAPPIPGMTPPGEGMAVESEFHPWWVDVLGVVFLVSGWWLFRRATPFPPVDEPEDPPVIASYFMARATPPVIPAAPPTMTATPPLPPILPRD